MAFFGPDLRGGLRRGLLDTAHAPGLVAALLVLVLLVVANQVLQAIFGFLALKYVIAGEAGDPRAVIKGFLVGMFPASLATALLAAALARVASGSVLPALNMRWPALGAGGWLVIVGGFLIVMYAAITVIVMVLGIDPSQYTPGPDGQSPETGSAGLVKEAMFDIANETWLFWLVLPSVALGAPIAEEIIFRGQLYSAIARSRLGAAGATLVTSLLWALLHVTEPWLSIGLIFVMGLTFGWLVWRFGSLWVTMACHAAWNLVYSLIIFGTTPS